MTKKNNKEQLVNGLTDALGLSNLGWSGDALNDPSALWNNISQRLISLEPMTLNYAYKTYGLLQTAIDQPVNDAFRGGVEISSATLSPEEVDKLEKTIKQNGDLERIQEALRWEALFGGAVLIANTDQDPDKILSEKRLKDGNLSFIASDRWESINTDPNVNPHKASFIYRGEQTIDSSRCRVLTGKTAPYYVRMRLQGWGLSELEATLPPLIQYLKSMNVILELLDEAKIDVLKIDGLSQVLAQADGTAKIRRRVNVAAANKNYKSMLTMDAKDSYEQKTLTFAGLSEMAKEIRIQVAAYLQRPVSKLWGVGSSGFSSGEDDLENYNSIVEDKRNTGESLLRWVTDLRCLQLFGRKVPDIEFKWKPLRVLSAMDEQTIQDRKIDNITKLLNSKILTLRQGAEKLQQEELINLTPEEMEQIPDEYQEIEMQRDIIEE